MLQTFDIAARRAELTPDKLALHELESGERVTYRELDRRANLFAEAMQRQGLQRGDRIAILCHNCAAFFEIMFGCAKAGLILVPLNWRQTKSELVPLLEDCAARLLIHDNATADLALALVEEWRTPLLSILTATEPVTPGSYQALLAEGRGDVEFPQERPADDIWYLLYTSGTTGMPKAVQQTFGMAWANYINFGQAIDLTSSDITPNYLPLFHTAGINLLTMPTLIAGGTVRIMPKFDAETLLALIDQGELTALLAVPAVYQALSLHPDFAETDFSKMRSWSSGGAPMPNDLVRLYADRGAMICQGYGMTETGPTVFLMDRENVLNKLGSIGKPHIMSRVRVVDLNGDDLPTGEAGELLIKGSNVTTGYWNRPEATAAALDQDGWLHTGDVGRVDEDGYYYIVDRIKDMYISGGENVYPAEVERLLVSHPDIMESAVVGIADDRWGEVGQAYLVAMPGRDLDLDEVYSYCRENLAAYKVPKKFCIVQDFPRTAAGKVRKHILRNEEGSDE